jgi:hypothetical protein
VAATSLLTSKEVRFLNELNRAGVKYLVVGLSAAALQGVPAVTQDIDLWVDDLSSSNFQKAVQRAGAVYVAPSMSNPPLLVGAGVELFDLVIHMHGLEEFEDEYANALEMNIAKGVSVRVLPLHRIIASKRATGRDKDKSILPVLEDALRAINDPH